MEGYGLQWKLTQCEGYGGTKRFEKPFSETFNYSSPGEKGMALEI